MERQEGKGSRRQRRSATALSLRARGRLFPDRVSGRTFLEQERTGKAPGLLLLIPEVKRRDAAVVVPAKREKDQHDKTLSGFSTRGSGIAERVRKNSLAAVLLENLVSLDLQFSKAFLRLHAVVRGGLVLIAPWRPKRHNSGAGSALDLRARCVCGGRGSLRTSPLHTPFKRTGKNRRRGCSRTADIAWTTSCPSQLAGAGPRSPGGPPRSLARAPGDTLGLGVRGGCWFRPSASTH